MNLNQTRHDSHSINATTSGWTTRRIATTSLFLAIAIIASFVEIPIFPAAPYLKYDPSGIVCLTAGFAFGPATGALVSILMWIPHLFGNPFGAIMAALANASLVLPSALYYKHHQTKKGAMIGLAIATPICLAVCIIANLIITPLYTPIEIKALYQLIIPVLVPFNLMKIGINWIVCASTYKQVSKIIAR